MASWELALCCRGALRADPGRGCEETAGGQAEDGTADVEAGRPAGFKATPEYLAAAVEDLELVPHRFDMTIRVSVEIDGDVSGPDAFKLTGSFDGERQYVRMDMGRLAGAGDDGRRMEQIFDIPANAL